MSKIKEQFDPSDFFYGPGQDKAGMRCVANMSEDELKQSLCRIIRFGLWQRETDVAYKGKRLMQQATIDFIMGDVTRQ
jgi:hypothetical protein